MLVAVGLYHNDAVSWTLLLHVFYLLIPSILPDSKQTACSAIFRSDRQALYIRVATNTQYQGQAS